MNEMTASPLPHPDSCDKNFNAKYFGVPDIIESWTSPYLSIAGGSVLDFGCGEGTAALGMAQRKGAARVVGVDIVTDRAICLANAKLHLGLQELPPNLQLRQIEAGASDDAGAFDLIYSWSVMEHVREDLLEGVVKQCAERLSPGGLFFVQISPLFFSSGGSHLLHWTPRPWGHLLHQHSEYMALLERACADQTIYNAAREMYETLNRITAGRLIEVLRGAGFEILREHRREEDDEIPPGLLEIYNEKALRTAEIVLLGRLSKTAPGVKRLDAMDTKNGETAGRNHLNGTAALVAREPHAAKVESRPGRPPVWEPGASPFLDGLSAYPSSRSQVLATDAILREGVVGLGEMFRDSSATYDERYLNIESKQHEIENALRRAGVDRRDYSLALDVGCGSGNATFSLLKMFDGLRVVATDLSPELLEILARRAQQRGVAERLTCIISDCTRLNFSGEHFDLITGSSMLHHLLDPGAFLDTLLGSLRPGGVALFTEPFRAGHVLMRQVLAQFVALSDSHAGFTAAQVQFFRDYMFTIDTMCREDREDPVFAMLDDKWMFTRAFFTEAANRSGLRCDIICPEANASVMSDQVLELIRLGTGETIQLPDWAARVTSDVDKLLACELNTELLFTGTIVFKKAESAKP